MIVKLIFSVFILSVASLGGWRATDVDITIDSRFRGEWVPAKAGCSSALRLKLDSALVTFVNKSDILRYANLEQCYSCMGRDVDDFVWLTTDQMGDSPFTIFLDGRKKPVSLSIDFANDKTLGRRFPFGRAPLKKCK